MISKLPNTGTSIFSVMSKMAAEEKALNLSQGFPDFALDPMLLDLVAFYLKKGENQYAPMPGIPSLIEGIGAMVSNTYGTQVAGEEITVTSGATEALFAAISALIQQGDEAIIFDPAYDSYAPAIALNGGVCLPISLQYPGFSLPWEEIEQKVNKNTKLLVVNSPHNPTGAVLGKEDWERIEKLLQDYPNLHLISDEVYEHIVFDGIKQQSALQMTSVRDRVCVVNSFGKTFHATGWKIGYAIAGKSWTGEIRKVHQYLTFSVNTPIQHALAEYIQTPKHYQQIKHEYQQKRDFFIRELENSKLEVLACKGTYFLLLSYAKVSDLGDVEMATWLTKKHKIASIPISVFNADGQDHKILRFCFAKQNKTLAQAASILCKI